MMKGKLGLIFALIAVFLGQSVYYYPQLPERIASHFGAGGDPNGWMSKRAFYGFEFALLLSILALFFFIPHLLPRVPAAFINLPNRDYWLAPGRRAETFLAIQERMRSFQVALLALFISVNQLVIRANLTRGRLSPAAWLMIGAYLLFTIFWLIGLTKTFTRREN